MTRVILPFKASCRWPGHVNETSAAARALADAVWATLEQRAAARLAKLPARAGGAVKVAPTCRQEQRRG